MKSAGGDDGELKRLRKQVRDLKAALAGNTNTIDALGDGEEQLRAIVEHSTDLFYLHTPDHVLKYVSPQSRKFFDCEPKEALVRWTEFLTDNPMNAKGILATQAAIDTGSAQLPYELELKGLKGRIIRVEVHEKPVVKNGKTLAIVGALTDITERKRAEEELSQNKEWLQLLIDRMPIGCIVWDTEFRVLLWNPTAERIFRYSAREALGKHPYQLIVPLEVRPQIDEVWKRLLSGDQAAHSLNENITRDGRSIICDWYNTPLKGNDGTVIGVISMAQEITDRFRAEEALRRSESKYRSIFNSASVSLWEEDFSKVKASIELLKVQGIQDIRAYLRDHPKLVREMIGSIRILDVNDTTLKLYGAESKDDLLRSLDKVLTPESAGLMLEVFIAIAERRPYFEVETKNRTLDGRVLDVLVSIAFPAERSAFKNCIVSILDISEMKKVEEERKHLEAQLYQVQKMEAIGMLAGGIAHDFNNILSAIVGYASLAKHRAPEGDPLAQYLDHILTSADRAARLTQGLLTFGRKQLMRPQPIDVNRVIHKTTGLLERMIGEDVEILSVCTTHNMTIIADAVQVEQVLINLAVNARDAMPGGGKLTITTGTFSMDEDFVARHGFGKPGEYALVSVADTGVGMDEATQERIFEPFFTTKDVGKGTGLGLSIVHGIVHQNDGYITCESRPGKGSTFRVYLPLVPATAEERGPSEHSAPARGSETILVAEDDAVLKQLAKTVLEEHGYTVILAADGEEAVRLAGAHRDAIQLLILDVIMPKKNGKEAFKEIRKMRPDIAALFISGYTADIVTTRGILEENIDFLPKPLTPAELLSKVRQVLDRRSPQ